MSSARTVSDICHYQINLVGGYDMAVDSLARLGFLGQQISEDWVSCPLWHASFYPITIAFMKLVRIVLLRSFVLKLALSYANSNVDHLIDGVDEHMASRIYIFQTSWSSQVTWVCLSMWFSLLHYCWIDLAGWPRWMALSLSCEDNNDGHCDYRVWRQTRERPSIFVFL